MSRREEQTARAGNQRLRRPRRPLPPPWRPPSRTSRECRKRQPQASEAGHVAARAAAGSRPRAAERGRQAGAAAGDRGAHHLETRQRRDQEPVAADHRRRHRRQGLREGAGRRARRRSRCAGRPVGADALDQCRRHRGRSCRCPRASKRWPPMSRRRSNWRAGWRRSAWCRASAAPSWYRSSRPASGWCRWKATSGAGTASSPRRMRRPARRGGWPSGRGWSISRTNSSRPASMPAPSARRWRAAEAELKAAAGAESVGARGMARRPARGRRRARAPCRYRARDQPPRRAQIGAGGSAQPPCTPTASRPQARMESAAAALAELPPSLDTETQARRRAQRHRRPSPARRAGARRSPGAGARGRTRRPPPAGDHRRAHRMAEPQGRRGLADRDHRGPHHRGHGRARRTRQRARRSSPKSAAR